MPTYEYECTSCGKSFDVFQNMSEDPISSCPSCGQHVKRRIHGGTGVIFKGSGFYKNDSRKAESAPKTECQNCASSPPSDAAKKEAV